MLSKPKPVSTKVRIGVVLLSITMMVAVVMASKILGTSKSEQPVLEILGVIPEFDFITQEGAPYRKQDMLGHVSIANFIFTRCPTICPMFSMKMQNIVRRSTVGIEFISFSVDPAFDTPLRLKEFSKDYQADPKLWHFLTGETDAIKKTVEGALKIPMENMGQGENAVPDIVHGVHFVLFDAQGNIRGYYNSDDTTRIDDLVRDATYLQSQIQKP